MNDIKAIIVDDHEIFRMGLSACLGKIGGLSVIGEFEEGQGLFKMLMNTEPDIVFMDLNLGEESGINLTRKLKAKFPSVHVIAITSYNDINHFKKMIDANADGYLLKNISEAELKNAIEEIMSGNQYFSKEFLLLARTVIPGKQRNRSIVLTDREREILRLICQGCSNQEIAEALDISRHTADTHRRNILSKTGAKNSAEMIMISFREGLIEAN